MGSRLGFLRLVRIVEHVFAEIALLPVGAIDSVAALGIAIPAASDIFRCAGCDLATGAAEGVVVFGERRIVGRRLTAMRAGAERERHERDYD